jgi:peptidyl-prolyl cis-trans isomerase SurA
MNEEVWQKGIQDSIGQMNYFQQNIKNYQWKNRVNAFIVKVLDPNSLEAARRFLKDKSVQQDLIGKFETEILQVKPLAYQTEIGSIEIDDHPILSRANTNLTYQEIEKEGITYLILLGEKKPNEPKKFDETRGIVIRDYQDYLEKTLLQNLTKKYPISINPLVKGEAFIILNQ